MSPYIILIPFPSIGDWFHSHINYFSLNTRHAYLVSAQKLSEAGTQCNIMFWNFTLRKMNCLFFFFFLRQSSHDIQERLGGAKWIGIKYQCLRAQNGGKGLGFLSILTLFNCKVTGFTTVRDRGHSHNVSLLYCTFYCGSFPQINVHTEPESVLWILNSITSAPLLQLQ